MARRPKTPAVHGIRPHMFNLWADDLMLAVKMQHDRLLEHGLSQNDLAALEEPDLTKALSAESAKVQVDFALYFTAARRLLRACEEAIREGYGGRELRLAVKQFKAELPGLIEVRDSFEHFDDFLRTGRLSGSGLGYGGGDAMFHVGPHRFELSRLTPAVRDLHAALKATVTGAAPDDIFPPLRPGEADRAIREATWFPPDA